MFIADDGSVFGVVFGLVYAVGLIVGVIFLIRWQVRFLRDVKQTLARIADAIERIADRQA